MLCLPVGKSLSLDVKVSFGFIVLVYFFFLISFFLFFVCVYEFFGWDFVLAHGNLIFRVGAVYCVSLCALGCSCIHEYSCSYSLPNSS